MISLVGHQRENNVNNLFLLVSFTPLTLLGQSILPDRIGEDISAIISWNAEMI